MIRTKTRYHVPCFEVPSFARAALCGVVVCGLSLAVCSSAGAAGADEAAASEEASADTTPRSPDKTEQSPAQARTFSNALVSGFVGLDFGARQMHYRDRVTNANLRPYDLPQHVLLPVAPGLTASAEVYPFATTAWPVARDLGLSGRLNYNFASSRVGDVTPKTRWSGYDLALRGRLQLGAAPSAPVLGLFAGIGRQAFLFSAPGAVANVLPSVDYYYLRFGADARIPAGPLLLLAGAAYRHLQSRRAPGGATVPAAGDFGEHFPKASIAGADLQLGIALPLREGLEARLAFDYVRYWSDLHSEPGDTYVAGGALDQFLNAALGIAACF